LFKVSVIFFNQNKSRFMALIFFDTFMVYRVKKGFAGCKRYLKGSCAKKKGKVKNYFGRLFDRVKTGIRQIAAA